MLLGDDCDGSGEAQPLQQQPLPVTGTTDTAGNEFGKLFIGGLSQLTTESSLRGHFSIYGHVEDAVVMMDSQTGRSRGFGFVKFRDPTVVASVLETSNHVIDGKPVDVKQSNINFKGKTSRSLKIFVGGIAPEQDANAVRTCFSQYGRVTDVNLMLDQTKQRHRGFAFVAFDDEKVVQRLVQLHFVDIGGSLVEVKAMKPSNFEAARSGAAEAAVASGTPVTAAGYEQQLQTLRYPRKLQQYQLPQQQQLQYSQYQHSQLLAPMPLPPQFQPALTMAYQPQQQPQQQYHQTCWQTLAACDPGAAHNNAGGIYTLAYYPGSGPQLFEPQPAPGQSWTQGPQMWPVMTTWPGLVPPPPLPPPIPPPPALQPQMPEATWGTTGGGQSQQQLQQQSSPTQPSSLLHQTQQQQPQQQRQQQDSAFASWVSQAAGDYDNRRDSNKQQQQQQAQFLSTAFVREI